MPTNRTRLRRARPRADLLSLLLIAAACACLWLGYANVYDAAAVFARERAEPETVTLLLPEQQWYVVREDGRTVAACASLIEAEIARDARASATEIAALKAESIELRVTAEKRCAEALEEAAAAVERTLSALNAMNSLSPGERMDYAALRASELAAVSRRVSRALSGVQNPVAMGLSGLANACAAAMRTLASSADDAALAQARAELAQQYAAYAEYVGDEARGREPFL